MYKIGRNKNGLGGRWVPNQTVAELSLEPETLTHDSGAKNIPLYNTCQHETHGPQQDKMPNSNQVKCPKLSIKTSTPVYFILKIKT